MVRPLATLPLPALALILGVAQAAPVPKHLMKKEQSFYPTEVGTKWTYKQQGLEFTQEITKSEESDGKTQLTVKEKGAGLGELTLEISKEGVFKRTDGPFRLDTWLLKFPLKPGDSWKVETPIQKGLRAHSGQMKVEKEEDVEVPAGKFRATKVVFEVTVVDGNPLAQAETYTYWYVAGIGEVRFDNDGAQWRVLTAFTPARK
jgi:hypothetical protein